MGHILQSQKLKGFWKDSKQNARILPGNPIAFIWNPGQQYLKEENQYLNQDVSKLKRLIPEKVKTEVFFMNMLVVIDVGGH